MLEVLHVLHLRGPVEVGERAGRVGLVEVRRPLARERDRLSVDRAALGDDAVHRALRLERVGLRRRGVAGVRRDVVDPREGLHRDAVALVQVVRRLDRGRRAVGLAQLLREGVDDVLAGRGRRPGEVLAAAEQHVRADAGEGGAVGVDVGAVEVLLDQDLRHEVGDLRAHHGDRVAGLGLGGRHEQGVRHRVHRAETAEQAPEPASSRLPPLLRGIDERARVGHRDAGAAALARVVEGAVAARDRGRRLGVVHAAEVAPRLLAGGAAVARLRGDQRERVPELAASALPEDSADQRGGRDHVGRLPVVERLPDRGVLVRASCSGPCGLPRCTG